MIAPPLAGTPNGVNKLSSKVKYSILETQNGNMNAETLEIITKSAKETQRLGSFLAREMTKSRLKNRRALTIGLEGELGSGKTTFIQGLAKGLGIKESMTSPTFVIFKKFTIPNQSSSFKSFYHIDCYRLKQPQELIELGFKEILNNPQNILVIEWAERIKKILPQKNILWINFYHLSQEQRRITIKVK